MIAEHRPRIAGMTNDPAVSENTSVKPATKTRHTERQRHPKEHFHHGAPSHAGRVFQIGIDFAERRRQRPAPSSEEDVQRSMMTAFSVVEDCHRRIDDVQRHQDPVQHPLGAVVRINCQPVSAHDHAGRSTARSQSA